MSIEEIKAKLCSNLTEKSVLSLIMKNIDFYYAVSSKLTQNDFLNPENSFLYSILNGLGRQEYKHFDVGAILEEMDRLGLSDMAGGKTHVMNIYKMPVDERNLDIYIKRVLDSSTKYHLYQQLLESADRVMSADDELPAEDLIGSVEAQLLDLSMASKAMTEPRDFYEGLEDFIEERRENAVEQSGISTGFPILDRQIDGLIPGTMLVVAARKKMGKSAFLTTIARYAAYHSKIPVLYIDTELTFNEWRTRVLAALTKTEERLIKHGGYDDKTYNNIKNAMQFIDSGLLFHEYMPGYTVEKVTALYKKYKIKHNIGLGVFDYIKEPSLTGSADKQRKEYQILGDVTTKLKDLAGQLDIPFLTAVQLNRDNDIADSDRIARYGDIIAHWSRREDKELEEFPASGGYKLVIRDTRRGGGTNEKGITYKFAKEKLIILEDLITNQPNDFKEVVNYGSDDSDRLE